MKVINLFGAPSAGKSSAMLGLAYKLKMAGLSIEKTDEYFKEMILEKTHHGDFGGQLFVLAEQNRRLARLEGKNDFAVTDCPLPLVTFYTPENYIEHFHQFSMNLFNQYDNVNYFIERNHAFENEKRAHDEEQANQINQDLKKFLTQNNIPFKVMKSSEDLVDRIVEDLVVHNIINNAHLDRSRNEEVRLHRQLKSRKF